MQTTRPVKVQLNISNTLSIREACRQGEALLVPILMNPEDFHAEFQEWAQEDWLLTQVPSFIRNPADRNDIAQQAWLQLAKVDPERIRNPASLRTYAIRTVYNIAVDHISGPKFVEATNQLLESAHVSHPDLSPERHYAEQQAKEVLYKLLQELPRRRRQILYLVCIEGFSRPQAARQLGLKLNTLNKELAIALEKIGERIQELTGQGGPRRDRL